MKATMTMRDKILGRYLFHVFSDNPGDPTTTFVRLKQAESEQVRITETLHTRAGEMEAEIFRRAQQVQEVNNQLRMELEGRKQAEKRLADHAEELTRFNRLAVGREQRMIEPKQQVNQLLQEMGKPLVYDLSFVLEARASS